MENLKNEINQNEIGKHQLVVQQIEKEIKKNNILNMLKWLFVPLKKEQIAINIWLEKKVVEIILTEEEAQDAQKKVSAYKKLWIDIDKGVRPVLLSESFHKNVFDLLTKKLSLKTIILLLKALWNKYKFEMSYIDDVVMTLDIPNSLKQDLLKEKSIFVLNKYSFPKKKDLMSKIRILSDKRTLREKWLWFLELAEELEKELELKKAMKKSLVMPIVVIIISLVLIVIVNKNVFPTFIKSFGATNPSVVQKITSNIVYQVYHFVINNWLVLLLWSITFIIIIFILKNISIVRYYWTAFLLKIPIIKNVIKYKELLKLVDILIWQYKYNLWFDNLYQSITNSADFYYLSNYYKYENIFNIHDIIKKMIEDRVVPVQESQILSTLLSWSGWYNNIKEIVELKEDIIKWYKEVINDLIVLVQRLLFWVMAVMVLLVVKAVYISLYDIFNQIN